MIFAWVWFHVSQPLGVKPKITSKNILRQTLLVFNNEAQLRPPRLSMTFPRSTSYFPLCSYSRQPFDSECPLIRAAWPWHCAVFAAVSWETKNTDPLVRVAPHLFFAQQQFNYGPIRSRFKGMLFLSITVHTPWNFCGCCGDAVRGWYGLRGGHR